MWVSAPGRPGLLGPGGWEGQEEPEDSRCELSGSGALFSGMGEGMQPSGVWEGPTTACT